MGAEYSSHRVKPSFKVWQNCAYDCAALPSACSHQADSIQDCRSILRHWGKTRTLICNVETYAELFMTDIEEAEKMIAILNPRLSGRDRYEVNAIDALCGLLVVSRGNVHDKVECTPHYAESRV